MREPSCRDVRRLVVELSEGGLGGEAARAARAHAAACSRCARVLVLDERLTARLRELGPAPAADFGPPALPAAVPGRLVALPVPRWVAAAAALLVAATTFAVLSPDAVDRATAVRVERVIDLPDAPPLVDEVLLALTAGPEAVAMRRPTELR